MRSRVQLALAFATALEGEDRTVLEELALPELAILVDALQERPRYASEANIELAAAPTIIPAAPGWRLAVLGPDEDLEACPIVAWEVVTNAVGRDLPLEPIARHHAQDGYQGASMNAGRPDHVVGILAPGEELGAGWVEAGEQVAKALREQEERTGD